MPSADAPAALEHAVHGPALHAELQHTPLAQKPLVHAAGDPQGAPSGRPAIAAGAVVATASPNAAAANRRWSRSRARIVAQKSYRAPRPGAIATATRLTSASAGKVPLPSVAALMPRATSQVGLDTAKSAQSSRPKRSSNPWPRRTPARTSGARNTNVA